MTLKHTVLYADDDVDDIELLKDVFLPYSNNVELVTFANGFQLISYLQNLKTEDASPCLIILDINMPLLDGKETLIEIRNSYRTKEVPVILFTTSSQPRDKEFAFKYNAGFITKPLNYQQLGHIADIFIDYCSDEVKKSIRKVI